MEGSGHNGPLRGGIDVGGTKIEAIDVDDDHKVLGQSRQPTPTKGGPDDVAAQMAEAMTGAAKEAGIETSALAGVGATVTSTVTAAADPVPRKWRRDTAVPGVPCSSCAQCC